MQAVEVPVAVVSVDRVEEVDDRYARHECLTCRASVRSSSAWRVAYHLGVEGESLFRATVCGRCARRILVAQRDA